MRLLACWAHSGSRDSVQSRSLMLACYLDMVWMAALLVKGSATLALLKTYGPSKNQCTFCPGIHTLLKQSYT